MPPVHGTNPALLLKASLSRTLLALSVTCLCACAPTLFYNQTFLVSEDLKLGQNGYASLPNTGETVDLSPIKAQEKSADRVHYLKVHGASFVVGEGFKQVWRLWSGGIDQAHYKPVKL